MSSFWATVFWTKTPLNPFSFSRFEHSVSFFTSEFCKISNLGFQYFEGASFS